MEITKGMKVFDRPVARTDAELWLKAKEHEAGPLNNYAVIENPKKTTEDRRQEFFSEKHRKYGDQFDYFEFHYEVENIRIGRNEQRDPLQDQQDAAEGIEVVHNKDQLKAKAEKKRAAKAHRKELKIRRAQRLAQPSPKPEQPEQMTIF